MSPSNDRRTTNSRPLPDPASQPTSPTSARTSRPLPVPASTTTSGTPQAKGTTGTIDPTSFYGPTPNARAPPPLPARPDSARSEAPPWDEGNTGLGSKLTTYVPPEASSGTSSPFRSPMLVPNSPHSAPPELIQDTTFDNNEWSNVTSAWNETSRGDNGWNGNDDWGMSKAADWATNWGEPLFPFKITGRNVEEENSWWDTETRQIFSRPGPGYLPPAVMEMVFAEGGTLHHVEVALPDEGELTRGPSKTPEEYVGPSIEDLHSVIPHPSAYFSPQECAWMIVLPREYVSEPKFTSRDSELPFPPWPNAGFRNANADKPCGKGGANVAHHFHRYDGQVDVRELEPEVALLVGHDVEIKTLNAVACCQCPMVVLMSTPLSAIIPRMIMDALAKEREDSPQPGQTKHDSVATAFNTLHIVIANRLWKNEERLLPVDGDSMLTRKMGTNDNVKKLFELLGFQLDKETSRPGLRPPRIDLSTTEGKLNRAKLLRAYIEIGAYMHRYYQKHGSHIKDSRHVNTIRIERATDHLQIVIGADIQTLPRDGPEFLYHYGPQQSVLNHLGITVPSATYECMAFAYLSQQRCDPERTPEYFEILQSYVSSAQLIGHEVPEWFQKMILNERERGRYTPEDFAHACKTFGFGPDGSLGIELDDADFPFLMLAFRHALENSGVLQRELTDQFRVLLRGRGVRAFMDAFNKHVETGLMTVDDAYRLLQATADVDEGMLIITAEMNASDSPSQADKIRDAISLIAEARNSHRLRKFLEIGVDPGEIMAPVRADMPRGLNQLGNTCYLNSLLQYFYTIKDLRDAVLQLSRAEVDKMEDDDSKLTEDDLKKHRVGGRLVTLKEIKRSRRFVKLLGELFWHMEHAEDPSITPALDLAKLALVTSKDEEEDSGARPSTDTSRTSADTDATLVDDLQMVTSPRAGSPQSQGSILGKRTRGAEAASESGDIEMGDVTPAPAAIPLVARKSTQIVDSGMMFGRQHDVAECMDNCMFQIETALLRFDDLSLSEADKASIVKRLFYGTLRQTISGNGSTRSKKSSHEKTDLFAHLPVQVSDEGHDLYDGLSGYFDDLVEFEGRQQRMEVTLVDLPPIIQIQLHRVQFDRETMQAYKNNAYVKFDETIRLDRFLDQADAKKRLEAKLVQSELVSCRARIEVLSKGKLAPAGPALLHVADFLTTGTDIQLPDVKQDTMMHLREEETLITEELRVLRARACELKANLEAIWASSESRAEYELTSVFIHRGTSPTFGHYFFYARNLPDHPHQWFKYNDAEVTEVGKDEVFADTTGQTANPYLLVYAQTKSGIINTVHRACDVADSDKPS